MLGLISSSKRTARIPRMSGSKSIRIENIPKHVGLWYMKYLCQSAGEIEQICLLHKIEQSTCCAEVWYKKSENAEKAIATLGRIMIDSCPLQVSYRKTREERECERKKTKVFFAHLPSSFKEKDLQALCTPFGEILRVRILDKVKTDIPRGQIGFVDFRSWKNAKQAISKLHGANIDKYQADRLIVEWARPREAKKTPISQELPPSCLTRPVYYVTTPLVSVLQQQSTGLH